MTKYLGINDVLHHFILQLSILIMWIIFALLHLLLFSVILFLLWFFKIEPSSFISLIRNWFLKPLQFLSILGISIIFIVVVYIKIFRKIYSRFITYFMFNELQEALKETKETSV